MERAIQVGHTFEMEQFNHILLQNSLNQIGIFFCVFLLILDGYARVYFYLDFIQKTMNENREN